MPVLAWAAATAASLVVRLVGVGQVVCVLGLGVLGVEVVVDVVVEIAGVARVVRVMGTTGSHGRSSLYSGTGSFQRCSNDISLSAKEQEVGFAREARSPETPLALGARSPEGPTIQSR